MYQTKFFPSKAIQAGCDMQKWLVPGTALSQLPAHSGQLPGSFQPVEGKLCGPHAGVFALHSFQGTLATATGPSEG